MIISEVHFHYNMIPADCKGKCISVFVGCANYKAQHNSYHRPASARVVSAAKPDIVYFYIISQTLICGVIFL